MKIQAVFFIALIAALTSVVGCKSKKDSSKGGDTTSQIPLTDSVMVSQENKETPMDTVIYYQRGACFGMCPIFNLTVYKGGKAVYEGKNFVDRIGFYQTKLNDAALQKVMKVASDIGYFGLLEEYDNPHVTDLPTTKTALAHDGKLKWVSNRYKGPPAMKTLYAELDSMIAHQKWEAIDHK